jgi:hypothetical protein
MEPSRESAGVRERGSSGDPTLVPVRFSHTMREVLGLLALRRLYTSTPVVETANAA